MKYLMLGAAALALAACSQETTSEPAETPTDAMAAGDAEPGMDNMDHGDMDHADMSASEKLDAVLDAQPDEMKARYQYRHPKETLEFFGVEPGMTVVDVLPGEPGWYGEILVPYLGPEGVIIGADYSVEMWGEFGGFANAEFLESKKSFNEDYVASVDAMNGEEGARAAAFQFGSLPAELEGTADVVLMMRAAHHFNRFKEGAYFTEALEDIDAVLKPGGIVGVVQHRAQEDTPDDWAVGNAGYVKQSHIISVFEAAGFELVEASEINANPADRPTTEEVVWRLPPSLGTSRDNPELRAEMEAIGESDRMTLKFRKPE
ncbi:class I SAM-dependent methyltransferase [Hyphococcus sp.]|jgi:predicted methyltransferase|uniref:class I SAM-dependent methyltransferase n=1 Tax=Hyphococcus sp. TaxID=2038636 RepID=UPI003D14656E